jgi:hypothetical protein
MSFDEWISDVFDREVSEKGWWSELPDDAPPREPPSITHLTRVSLDSAEWSKPFSDQQLGQGLWFVFHDINDNLAAIGDASVPIASRAACVLALRQLYLGLFSKRCTSELGRSAPNGGPPWSLNMTCYMLWDIAEFQNPRPGLVLDRSLDEACLSAMRSILQIPHPACQKSALHGLGHWHERFPQRTSAIVDEFLENAVGMSPDLSAYARSVRERP